MRGVPSVTVARVIARARVSRRLFYELFVDIEDCFLATFDWGVEQARVLAVDAYTAEQGWREGVRAGLAAILRFFDERPLIAQLCVVHAAGGGPRVLERRALVIAELCEVVDRGRASNSRSAGVRRTPAPVMAEGVVGAVMAVLYARLHAQGASAVDGYADRATQQPQPLIELHGELMSVIVLPYLGSKVAGNELRRAVPAPRPQLASIAPELVQSLPSERSGSRLTYRTVRVLMSIAELPGPQQSRGCRTGGHRRPGSDLQVAHTPGVSRLDRQSWCGQSGARNSQRVVADRARRSARARIARASVERGRAWGTERHRGAGVSLVGESDGAPGGRAWMAPRPQSTRPSPQSTRISIERAAPAVGVSVSL